MALRGGIENLSPGVGQADGALHQVGCQPGRYQRPGILPVAERAAGRRNDHADLGGVDPQGLGDKALLPVRLVGAGDHGNPPAGVNVAQGRVALQRAVLLEGGLVHGLEDSGRSCQRGACIAPAHLVLVEQVPLRGDLDRAGPQRLPGVEGPGEQLVIGGDPAGRRLGLGLRSRRSRARSGRLSAGGYRQPASGAAPGGCTRPARCDRGCPRR